MHVQWILHIICTYRWTVTWSMLEMSEEKQNKYEKFFEKIIQSNTIWNIFISINPSSPDPGQREKN